MKRLNYIIFLLLCLVTIVSCSKEKALTPDFVAPTNIPPGVEPGTPINDAILQLYDETGIVVYKDTGTTRFVRDLVSNETLIISGKRIPADTAAMRLYIRMIKEEFYDVLPEDKKSLAFRNFYLIKNDLVSGSGYSIYTYDAILWSNSNADVTMGYLNDAKLDTNLLKASFFYALSGRLRNSPSNASYLESFVQMKEDWGTYYFYVTDQESAYENGFLSADQTKITTDQQDFDLFAAWIATTPPDEREELLELYPILWDKYQIVTNMFHQEGIILEDIAAKWQLSPLHP